MSFTQSASPPVNIFASLPWSGAASSRASENAQGDADFLGVAPAFSAKLCSRARPLLKRLTGFIGNCGLVPTGYQPWAYLTVRRSAGPLSQPTRIGIGTS